MSTRAVSKLTSKYQTTVPAVVREALCLEKGDALQSQLSEWASDEDDKAYRGL